MSVAKKLFLALFCIALTPMVLAEQPKQVNVVNEPGVIIKNTNPVDVKIQEPLDVNVQGVVNTSQRLPIAVSGDWDNVGGQSIFESMIIHDLIFFNADAVSCTISIAYVINVSESRSLYYVTLIPGYSRDFHFEAGIHSSLLRFGRVGLTTDPICSINWAAMGYAVEQAE